MRQEWDYEAENAKVISNWKEHFTNQEIIDALCRLLDEDFEPDTLVQDPRKLEHFKAEIEKARSLAERYSLKLAAETPEETVGSIELSGRWLPFSKDERGEPWFALRELIDGCNDMRLDFTQSRQELELYYELGTEQSDSAEKQ